MFGEPRFDVALTPAQQPRARDMQARRYRQRIPAKVFFNRLWTASKQRSELMKVKQFQDFGPKKRFSGHARAVEANTCCYVP
jgi:hypothetical protein